MKTRFLASLLALLLAIAPALADQSTLSSPTTGTVSGLQLTNNYNAALNALNTCNSGGSAPTNQLIGVPSKGNCWLDTGANLIKVYDGTNWLIVGSLDTVNHIWVPVVGGGYPTIASGATTDLCASSQFAMGTFISGITTITSFGSNCAVGEMKVLTFTGALTLTHSASLILPNNGNNITTTNGDSAVAVYSGAGVWRVTLYMKANGQAVAGVAVTVTTNGDSNYVILSTDQSVITSAAFTLPRTWTLPAAAAFGAGKELKICDAANGVSFTNTLTVTRAGADTIVLQGTTVTNYTLANAGVCTSLFSDGTSKWLVYSQRMIPLYATFTSGVGATFNTPSGATYLKVRMIGGGGGGSNNGADGGTGGTTSFGSWTAIGGAGSRSCSNGGSGGANGTGVQVIRMQGAGANQTNISLASAPGALTGPRAAGASSPFGGGGGVNPAGTVAYGSGGPSNTPQNGQIFCSGSAGEYVEFMVPGPAGSYLYTVGGGGTAPAGAVAGAAGVIIIEAVFN